ncbi:MAG: hypothetical protein WDW36_001901 [Sanguina aurantia]
MQPSQPRLGMSNTALIQQLLGNAGSNQHTTSNSGNGAVNASGFSSAQNAAIATALMTLGGPLDSGQKSSTAYATRHQAAEQRRRTRINERLELLRKIVPHTERANTASFLEEVIKYIDGLKRRTVDLEAALSSSKNARLSAGGAGGNPHHQPQQQHQHHVLARQAEAQQQQQQQHQQSVLQQQLLQMQMAAIREQQQQQASMSADRPQAVASLGASLGAALGGASGCAAQLTALELALSSGMFQSLAAGGGSAFSGSDEMYGGGAAGQQQSTQSHLQAQQLAHALAQVQQQAMGEAAAAAAGQPTTGDEHQAEADGVGEGTHGGGAGVGTGGSAHVSTSETPASSEESGVPIKKRKVVS